MLKYQPQAKSDTGRISASKGGNVRAERTERFERFKSETNFQNLLISNSIFFPAKI